MKWAIRALLALVAVLVLAAVAALVLAPRLVDRPEVRERIAAAAHEATGRTLRYEKLGVGLLPPRLEVEGVALEGGREDAPLRAERIALEVALLPLLSRTVLVDALVVRGVELTLVRTQQGIELPIEPPPPEPDAETKEGEGEPGADSDGVSIAVREVRIEDSRLTLSDRTVRPAAEWVFDALTASARGRLTEDAPIDFDVASNLHGARLRAAGQASLAGRIDAELTLDGFPLERLAPYLPEGLALAGPADLAFAPEGELESFAGPLRVDLTAAEIVRGDAFRKPAGDRAALAGRLVRKGEAIRLEDGQLTLRDVTLAVTADLAPRTRARLAAPRFELSSFAGWLPGLAASDVSGGVALDELDASFDPLSLRGGIVLDEVNTPVGETRGVLSGRLEGKGDSLVGDAMDLRVAGQPFRLGLVIDSLASAPHAALRLASTEGADSGQLISGVSGKPASLEGPLALATDLRAPLSDPDALVRALTGSVELGITPGRLHGVSFLRSVFDAIGHAGGIAERLGAIAQGDKERLYRDAFETLAGSFQIAGGLARTEDLRLVYEDYRVDLTGVYGLLDESLDFRGKLTMFEAADRALAEGAARGVKREIPIASVKGTLHDPKVSISPQAALAFAAQVYGGSTERMGKLGKKIDEELGEGSGKQVIDLLDSVLGGGKKKEEEEP